MAFRPVPQYGGCKPRTTPDRRDNENVTPSSLQYYFLLDAQWTRTREGVPSSSLRSLLHQPPQSQFQRASNSGSSPPFPHQLPGTPFNLMAARHRTQNICSFRSGWRLKTTERFPVGLLLPFPGTLPQKPLYERRENPLPGFSSHPPTPHLPHLGAVTNTDKLTSFTWDSATDKTWAGACLISFFPVHLLAASLEGLRPSFGMYTLRAEFPGRQVACVLQSSSDSTRPQSHFGTPSSRTGDGRVVKADRLEGARREGAPFLLSLFLDTPDSESSPSPLSVSFFS